MVRTRAAPATIRFAWAALFALLLAVRSLAPAGFMPAFDHGAVTIVACPDSAPAPAHHRHGGDDKRQHQSCPYAAASVGVLGMDWTPLPEAILFAFALLLGRAFLFVERQAVRERPPSRGPPLPA
jgi:hypothetical protein